MQLLTLNAAGKPLAPARTLDPKRRRLSQVIGRHVDRRRPHMIAVQRARDPLQPIEEAWVLRGRDKAGRIKPWPRRYLPADAIVVVVYLPRGGGGAAGGRSSSKGTVLSIAAAVAAVALTVFGGPLGATAAAAIGISQAVAIGVSAGVLIGATVLSGIASQAKANKQATDRTQVYGVSGGGNLPRPGDRIPRGYGRSWMKPDLSQPDFSQYDGDDQILFKRHTIGLGKYRVYQVRAGKQIVWTESGGFQPPFDGKGNAIEFINGTASTLVPNNVISATGVGGTLPRPEDNPSIAGPFRINQTGALVNRLQIDFQYPQGISATSTSSSGVQRPAGKSSYNVLFEYAPIDSTGAVTGPWQTLVDSNPGNEGGLRFATHPLRYTRFLDVPLGRYAVRGRNRNPDTSQRSGAGTFAAIDAAQWDSASGWVPDAAIRPGVTELCLRMYATKGTQAAAFGELEVDAAAIIPVWTGTGWQEQETSKAVWAYLDVLRNQDYGAALPDSQIDLGTALGYASSLTEFDTFDGTIRGPVSVYEAAATVLLPLRAEPVHLGRAWSLVRDEPKSVRRHVITRRQIVKGSTQIVYDLDTAAGAGHVVGEFDQDGDYRVPNQVTQVYGEASLTPTRQRWTGVKTYAHAQHLTRWRAASGAYRRQTTPFSVEMEGRIYRRGDSIAVDQWFVEGRKVAGVVASIGDRLFLDADVTVSPGDAAVLRDRAGREWGPVALAGQGSSVREIVFSASARIATEASTGQSLARVMSDGRGEMTTVIVGPVSILTQNYLIRSAQPSGDNHVAVEALIDDARVWAAIGAGPTTPPTPTTGLSDPESPRIVGLTANATPLAAGLRCDYAITPGRGCRRFEVGISYDSGARFDVRPDAPLTGSIDLNPVDPQTVVLRARAFGATGLPGPYFLTTLALPGSTVNVTLPPIDYAGLTTEVRARIDHILEVEAQANARADDLISRLELFAGNANAAVINEASQRIAADQAQATQITGIIARIGSSEAAVATEITARTTADSALASRIDVVQAGNADTLARLVIEGYARADGDSAVAQQVSVVSAKADDTLARLVIEGFARADGDGALSSRIDAVVSRTTNTEAAVVATNQSIATLNAAYANQFNELYARSDAGTAVGRFSMQAVSGPSGVSARIQALLATTRGGQTYGAGYYLDLLADGTSRFVIDANAFYITANGSTAPAFSFDGYTLSIPSLRVTQQAVLPGAVSDLYAPGITNFSSLSTATGWHEVPGTDFTINADGLWTVIITVTTNLYVYAGGSTNTYVSALLQVGLGVNGNIYSARVLNSATVGAGGGVATNQSKETGLISSEAIMEFYGAGQTRFSVLYNFAGGASTNGNIKNAQIKAIVVKR